MAGYEEEDGDLFEVDTTKYVLAHCISADVTVDRYMNAGIAREFRKRYPRMAGVISVGLWHELGKSVRYHDGDVTVYNLVSKPIYSDKVTHDPEYYYRNLTGCLGDMRRKMELHGETAVAMPTIACGLDKGDWDRVRTIIKNVFIGSDIDVLVRVL